MKHHTKTKGDLGVLKAQADLAEQGFTVLLPLTEHAPFDLAIYSTDVGFQTVQVKYRSLKSGTITVHFRSSWNDKSRTHVVKMNKEYVDIICIYIPETGYCYYLKPKDFGESVTLRVETPKNNQTENIHLASDYRRVP